MPVDIEATYAGAVALLSTVFTGSSATVAASDRAAVTAYTVCDESFRFATDSDRMPTASTAHATPRNAPILGPRPYDGDGATVVWICCSTAMQTTRSEEH